MLLRLRLRFWSRAGWICVLAFRYCRARCWMRAARMAMGLEQWCWDNQTALRPRRPDVY